MRKIFLTAALAAGFAAAGSLMPSQADAMTISTPAAVQDAIGGGSLEQVRYACYRVRRCGYNGCYWRRVCDWRPGYGYYGGYGYPGYGFYGYRRHRHWY